MCHSPGCSSSCGRCAPRARSSHRHRPTTPRSCALLRDNSKNHNSNAIHPSAVIQQHETNTRQIPARKSLSSLDHKRPCDQRLVRAIHGIVTAFRRSVDSFHWHCVIYPSCTTLSCLLHSSLSWHIPLHSIPRAVFCKPSVLARAPAHLPARRGHAWCGRSARKRPGRPWGWP